MLVIAWEAMNSAIPRIQAEERLDAYTVAVLASPPPDQDSVTQRQKIINQWQQLIIGPSKKVIEVTVAKLKVLLMQAFDEQIRD
jgi:hypothetical protein